MDIYLYRKKVKSLRMQFCQLIISALTHQKDLLDFGKVSIEFIPSSNLNLFLFQHGQGRQNNKEIKYFAITSESRWKNSLSNSLNYIFGSRRLRPPSTAFSIF